MRKLLFLLVALVAFGSTAGAQIQATNQIRYTLAKAPDWRTHKTVAGVSVPRSTVSEANTAIPTTERYPGLTICIGPADSCVEYWYNGGTHDTDLKIKLVATTETDPVWTGVAGLYRTNTQNAAIYAAIVHTHAASDITQDATHRFITDAERTMWNSMSGGGLSSTDELPQGSTNLYYSDALARSAFSLTGNYSTGPPLYNSTTGVLNIPNRFRGEFATIDELQAVSGVKGDWATLSSNDSTPLRLYVIDSIEGWQSAYTLTPEAFSDSSEIQAVWDGNKIRLTMRNWNGTFPNPSSIPRSDSSFVTEQRGDSLYADKAATAAALLTKADADETNAALASKAPLVHTHDTDDVTGLVQSLADLRAAGGGGGATVDSSIYTTRFRADSNYVKKSQFSFWLPDYGAIGGGDTSAATRAINNVAMANALADAVSVGGEVVVPGWYVFDSVMIPANNGNAGDTTGGDDGKGFRTIQIRGSTPPNQVFGTVGSTPMGTTGCIIQVINYTVGRAVIQSRPFQGSFSGMQLRIKDLDIRAPYNPYISGIDAKYSSQLHVQNVHVNVGVYSPNICDVDNSADAAGIVTPMQNNGGVSQLRDVAIDGFPRGLYASEHTDGVGLNIQGCVTGIALARAVHASHFARLCMQNNTYHIFAEGWHRYKIDLLNIEHATLGTVTPCNTWQQTVADIYDLVGCPATIWYAVTEGGNMQPNSDFTIVGGAATMADTVGGNFGLATKSYVDSLVAASLGGGNTDVPFPSALVGDLSARWRMDSLVYTTGGTSLDSVQDLSGRNNTLMAASGTAPAYDSTGGPNSRAAALFNGTSHSMWVPVFDRTSTTANEITTFIVFNNHSSTNTIVAEQSQSFASQTGDFIIAVNDPGLANSLAAVHTSNGLTVYGKAKAVPANTWCFVRAENIKSRSTGETDVYVNGSNSGTITLGSDINATDGFNTGEEFYVGSRANSSLFTDMDVAEIIIFNKELDATEAQSVIDYIKARYNFP